MIFLLPQEGQRNTTLTHAAYTMGKKVGGGLLDEDVAHEILAELGAPWDLDQVEITAPAALIKQWVEDICVTGQDRRGKSYFTPTGELYLNYSEWCAENDHKTSPIAAFVSTLEELGFMPTIQRVDGMKKRGFDGIGLTGDDQEDWDKFEIPLSRPIPLNPVSEWVRVSPVNLGGAAYESVTPASELYRSFRAWCVKSGIPNVGFRRFVNILRGLGIREKIIGGNRVLIGIEFSTDDQEEDLPFPSEDDLNEYGPGLFFSQWLEQMEEKPGESTKEDTLYMAYHRYCEYYRECPLTLTGFRQGMEAHSIDYRPDISQGNVNVYDGIAIPASFHTAMYGEPIF